MSNQVKRIMHREMVYRRNSYWWAAMRWLDRVGKLPKTRVARVYPGSVRAVWPSKHRTYPARMYRKLLRLPPTERED